MTSKENMVSKLKHSVISGKKTPSDLADWIKTKFDVKLISFSKFSDAFFSSIKFNALHAITNKYLCLSEGDFEFVLYQIIENEKSNVYYDSFDLRNAGEEFIFIILERKTGYVFTNHNKLQLELVMEQGISQYDYDNETDVFVNYLSCIDRINKGEY